MEKNLNQKSAPDVKSNPTGDNTERPPGDWQVADVPNIQSPNIQPGEKMNPSTEDRSAVKAPDDTFPGSGPEHGDAY